MLAVLTAVSFSPEALAQAVNIPLQLEQGASGVILTINVGINGAAPRPYLFDTGSALFNAFYTPSAFGGLPGNMASQGLPTGVFYSYGDGPSGVNEYDSNVVAVPSLTFYATPTSTSGVTVNAVTSSGAASNFYVNAVYAHRGDSITDSTTLQSVSLPGYSYGGYYGIFGASGIVYDALGGTANTPPGVTQDTSHNIGSILGQTVVSGTTAGYVVAANGQALSNLPTGQGPVPGSLINGPQPTHCVIASCDPAVMLGLTPALLAQFAPANTQTAAQTPGLTFPNTGITGWSTFPNNLTVTVKVPGQAPVSFTQQSVLDSGTADINVFSNSAPLNAIAVPRGATVTISDGNPNSATSFVSNPTPVGRYGYINGPYDVEVAYPGNAGPSSYIGIGFFLQNSVLFDLAGDAIGWTPNYVTAANITTTPQAPLVIDSGSVPLGLAGVISGDGGVAITQGGSATLSGTNTYTGATSVIGGYLALVGPGSISSSSSVNVSAGGIFDISGVTLPGGAIIQSLAGDANGTVYLGPNTLVLSNASGSYAGILYGSGGLTLNGGVETLSGIDAYGGPTTVNRGFLVVNGVLAGTSGVTVNAGGALGGDGIIDPPAVTIASGGTLAPGKPGVAGSGMMIIGDLAMQPGSTFMSLVGTGGASFANVSGTATLAGTATAAFAGGPLSKSYTILSASSLNGTFDNFTTVNLPQSLSAGITSDSNSVYLNFTSHMAAILGLTENQRAIASNLDSYFNSGRTLPASFGSLYALSGSTLANGISTLSGETTTGAEQTAFQLMDNFLGAMLDPFVDGRPGANANTNNGGSALGYASASHGVPSQFADAYAALKAPKLETTATQPWAVWGAAYGGSLSLNANDAASGAHDVSGSTYGFATGADYRATPNTTLGFAVASGGTNWSLSDGLGGGNSTAAQVGLYARTQSGPAYLAGALAFTNYWFNTTREAFNADPLSGQFGAQSFGARAEAGYRFNMPASTLPAMTWTPYAAVQPQTFHSQAFSETDVLAGGLALNYQANDTIDTRTEIGARVATSVPLLNGMAVDFQGRAAWAHDFISTPILGVAFQSLPGSSFAVFGARLADNSALVSAGGELHITRSLSLLAKFDGEFARQEQIATGRAILRYSW